jgi:hypothetical protein
MITSSFIIHFDFLGDEGKLKIPLVADVEVHHSRPSYVIKNFKVPGREGRSLLPEIRLRKSDDQWVHADSGKASELSIAVGQAIDAREKN